MCAPSPAVDVVRWRHSVCVGVRKRIPTTSISRPRHRRCPALCALAIECTDDERAARDHPDIRRSMTRRSGLSGRRTRIPLPTPDRAFARRRLQSDAAADRRYGTRLVAIFGWEYDVSGFNPGVRSARTWAHRSLPITLRSLAQSLVKPPRGRAPVEPGLPRTDLARAAAFRRAGTIGRRARSAAECETGNRSAPEPACGSGAVSWRGAVSP
jgi:hypothetical protein